MKILITGFMPFGGHQTNVTKLLLDDFTYKQDNHQVYAVILPTTFKGVKPALEIAIATYHPDIIIHLGEHAKTDAITLERVAINIDDARIPDNDNFQPIDETIEEDGKLAYFSSLPLRAIESALKMKNIPVKLSYSAGTFVCNHLFYVSESINHKEKKQKQTGFIHLPLVDTQDEQSPFKLTTLKQALTTIIDTCINY